MWVPLKSLRIYGGTENEESDFHSDNKCRMHFDVNSTAIFIHTSGRLTLPIAEPDILNCEAVTSTYNNVL